MKKIFSLLLVVIYLVPAVGLSVNTHHCGGMLAAIHIVFLSDKHKCGCGNKAMDKNCCNDKIQQFKISDKHFASLNIIDKTSEQNATIIPYSFNFKFITYQLLDIIAFHPHVPPDSPICELYVSHCAFLI